MPMLPSGRRIKFSLDRFHKLLVEMGNEQARAIASNIEDPDDLLFVLDAVHFSLEDATPYFADYVASDWKIYAADWSTSDRLALQAWLVSDKARSSRAEDGNRGRPLFDRCRGFLETGRLLGGHLGKRLSSSRDLAYHHVLDGDGVDGQGNDGGAEAWQQMSGNQNRASRSGETSGKPQMDSLAGQCFAYHATD